MPSGDDVIDKKRGFRIEGTVASKDEHALIAKAAAHKGMSISQFVVYACLREARGDKALDLLFLLVERLESGIRMQDVLGDKQEKMLARLDEADERQKKMRQVQHEVMSTLNTLIPAIEHTNRYIGQNAANIEKISACIGVLTTMIEKLGNG